MSTIKLDGVGYSVDTKIMQPLQSKESLSANKKETTNLSQLDSLLVALKSHDNSSVRTAEINAIKREVQELQYDVRLDAIAQSITEEFFLEDLI